MVSDRNIYLQQVPQEEALQILQDKLNDCQFYSKIDTEKVCAENSLNRVTANAIYGKISSPHYIAASMDGIAVDSSDTYGASESNPIFLEMEKQAVEIDTGDILPGDKDSVIKIEDVNLTDDNKAEIISASVPWKNVRPIGEDIVATEMLFPSNHKIRPCDIGAILAGGITEIEVHKLPKVAVLPTGTELVDPGENLNPGDIIEYNSRVMAAMVNEWGGVPVKLPKTIDDYEKLKKEVQNALVDNDILIINAGSSAGREDYTASLIKELGELLVHGVAIKPGKPVVLGIIAGKPVIGIPGFPVSAALSFEIFVKPLVYALAKKAFPQKEKIKCKLSRRVYSPLGSDEYVRVNIGKIKNNYIANPLSRGAGKIMSLVKAQGILRVSRFSEGLEAGEEVDIELLQSLKEIKNSLLIIGSHDLSLDVLNDWMNKIYPGYSIVSSHVGSLGGLLALKRGEAHAAGVHLLDPETGEYNISYIKKYLPDLKMKLVNLVYRDQGLLVKKGNPYNIKGIEDLKRSEITYINRQKGAGTRVLLDYLLDKNNISSSKIKGYEREEFTHLNVGVAISSGTAVTGMGIKTAADALGLDFIPIAKEKYDLCIPADIFDTDLINKLLQLFNNTELQKKLQSMGYDIKSIGEIISCD